MNFHPSFSLLAIINLLGVAQAVFFSVLLVTGRRRGSWAHSLLAVFLLAYALAVFEDVLLETRYLLVVPQLSLLLSLPVFALGPLLFAYVRTLTAPAFRLRRQHLLHLVPLLLVLGLFLPYLLLNAPEKRRLLQQAYQHPTEGQELAYVGIVHVGLYLGASLRLVGRYTGWRLATSGTPNEAGSVRWLLSLLLAFVALWVAWLLNTRYATPLFQYAEALLFTGFVYAFGIGGINQPELFRSPLPDTSPVVPPESAPAPDQQLTPEPDPQPAADPKPEPGLPARKYEKAGIPPDQIAGALVALQHQMTVAKVYRDNELTLSALAQRLGLPAHHLSHLLNEHLHTSFYEYLNKHRVEDVKAALANPANEALTILALAWEAGFNSKGSFNIAFKKHTGLTPSAYKRMRNDALLNEE